MYSTGICMGGMDISNPRNIQCALLKNQPKYFEVANIFKSTTTTIVLNPISSRHLIPKSACAEYAVKKGQEGLKV